MGWVENIQMVETVLKKSFFILSYRVEIYIFEKPLKNRFNNMRHMLIFVKCKNSYF